MYRNGIKVAHFGVLNSSYDNVKASYLDTGLFHVEKWYLFKFLYVSLGAPIGTNLFQQLFCLWQNTLTITNDTFSYLIIGSLWSDYFAGNTN